jgi:hypothetical protein
MTDKPIAAHSPYADIALSGLGTRENSSVRI